MIISLDIVTKLSVVQNHGLKVSSDMQLRGLDVVYFYASYNGALAPNRSCRWDEAPVFVP